MQLHFTIIIPALVVLGFLLNSYSLNTVFREQELPLLSIFFLPCDIHNWVFDCAFLVGKYGFGAAPAILDPSGRLSAS